MSLSLKNSALLPVAICGAASVILTFVMYPFLVADYNLLPDAEGNLAIANNIYDGAGFTVSPGSDPSIFHAPLVPYAIALVFKITGGSHLSTIRIAQVFLNMATCFLLFKLAARIYSPKEARITGILYALYPPILLSIPRVYVEQSLSFFLLLAVNCMILYQTENKNKWNLFAGLALGLAALSRDVVLLFPLIYLVFLAICKVSRRKIIVSIATLLAAMWLLILPWTVRNYRVAGRLIPVQAGFGFNYIMGTSFVKNFSYAPLEYGPYLRMGLNKIDHILREELISDYWTAEADRVLMSEAIREIIREPTLVLQKLVAQSMSFWYLSLGRNRSILLALIQFPFLIMGFLGWVHPPSGKARMSNLPLLTGMYLMFSAALIFAISRSSLPAIPYVLLYAGRFISRGSEMGWSSISGLEEEITASMQSALPAARPPEGAADKPSAVTNPEDESDVFE